MPMVVTAIVVDWLVVTMMMMDLFGKGWESLDRGPEDDSSECTSIAIRTNDTLLCGGWLEYDWRRKRMAVVAAQRRSV